MKGKVKTGIVGLDKLLTGGIPDESVVLVSGSPGTGKTILGLQFLVEGARKKEPGVYMTFEEREEKIHDQGKQFGWDMKKLEKEKMLKVISLSDYSIVDIFQNVKSAIDKFKPKRFVIDSLTFMSLAAHSAKTIIDLERSTPAEVYAATTAIKNVSTASDDMVVRKMMTDFVKILQARNITTLLTSELSRDSTWYSRDTLSEFACDGIIHLKSTSIGNDMQRTMEIVKMRNCEIKGGIYNYHITTQGITVNVSD